jgi:peptidyl-prolyl cis-trans isomerase A (cyclophilin A)
MRACSTLVLALALTTAGDGPAAPLPEKKPSGHVTIETSLGDIVIELYDKDAPASVANFLAYVDDKFYPGTVFHRVIPGFMIQGGGLLPDMTAKPTQRPPVKNESANDKLNRRGTVAVARAADPDSGTCQFYINLKDNAFLDPQPNRAGWCVFGEVVAGMDVVEKIAAVPTGERAPHQNVPLEPVVIKAVRRGR